MEETNIMYEQQIDQLKINHKKDIDIATPQYALLQEEYEKALTEIAKIQNENALLKAREDVLHSFQRLEVTRHGEDEDIEECIMEQKCEGNCKHIEEEDLRNLKKYEEYKESRWKKTISTGSS